MSDFRVVEIKTESKLFSNEVEEYSSRCGEIFVGDDAKKWTFICTLCDQSFREINEFMSHIKGSHVNIPPPPSAEPFASDHVSMQEKSFKCESPLLNTLDNPAINEFEDYNDFMNDNVESVPDDILSESSLQSKVPGKQVVKPGTHRMQRVSNSESEEIPEVAVSTNSPVESYSPCSSINYSAKVESSPTDVLRIKNKKRRYCPICNRDFQYLSIYQKHMLKHTSDNPFRCTICEKVFKSKQAISYHLKTHQRDKFECKVCSAQFYLKTEFISHLETHKSIDKATRIHIRTHTVDLPLACKFCSKRFRMRQHLGNHLKLHFTYRCDHCGKQFRNGVFMKKPYACKECRQIECRELDYDEGEDSEDYDDEEKDETFHPVYSKVSNRMRRNICKHCNKRYTSKRGLSIHISTKHSTHNLS